MQPPSRRRLLLVSACVGAVVVVTAIGVITAAQGDLFWLYGQPHGGCPAAYSGSGPTPFQASAALGEPTEQVRGPNHWYNFSVQSGGGGVTWGEISLQVVTATGANVTATGLWTAEALALNRSNVATYSFGSGTWTGGSNALFMSSETLVLDSGTTNLSALGYTLNVVGVGCFQGSISVPIP